MIDLGHIVAEGCQSLGNTTSGRDLPQGGDHLGEHNPISISHNPNDALNRRVDIAVDPMEVKPEAIKEEASKKTKE